MVATKSITTGVVQLLPETPLPDAAEYAEYTLIGSILHDPTQWYDVHDVTPALFGHPSYRAIWEVISDRKGQTPPSVLFSQLQKSDRGKRALQDLGEMDGLHRLFHDGASAGEASAIADEIRRLATQREIEAIKQRIRPDQFNDPSDYAMALVSQINRVAGRLTSPLEGGFADGVTQAFEDWVWLQNNPGKIRGVRSGLDNYDRAVGGFEGGQLIIACGSSGEGKSQLKCYMAIRAALTPHDVTGDVNRLVFFSLEMEKREHSKRWLVYLARVDYNREHASPDDHRRMAEAFAQLKELQDRIFVSPPAACSTLDQIIRGLRWYKDRNDVAIAYVDYAQLINVPGSGDASRYDQMAQVARRLKLAAQELGIPIVLGVQLNREAVSKSPAGRPGVHHIADSLDLLRSADVATMIWNPSRYLAGQQVATWEGKVVLLTPKIRHRATPPPFIYGYEQVFSTFKVLNPALEQELRGQLAKLGETRSTKP